MTKATVSAFIVLVLAVFLYIIWGGNLGATFNTRDAPSLVSSNFFVVFDENFFKKTISDGSGFYTLTADRVARFDINGELIWEHQMNLESLTFVHNGSYIAASAYRARIFRAFGPRGILHTLTFENDILSYNIAANGYSVIMTQSEGGYNIDVFNSAGNHIKRRPVEARNLFPMSMDISPDGRILVVSYLDISGSVILSYICAYYIRESDAANYTDGLFASFRQLEGEIISKVRFIDSSSLMYSSDARFGVYELGPGARFRYRWSKELDNRTVFLEAVNNVGIAVAFGSSLLNREGFAEGTFIVYGVNGDVLATYNMDGSITHLSVGSEAVVIGGGSLRRSFAAIKYRNRVAWEYTATTDVLDFVILDRPERALIVTPTRMEIMEVR